MLLTILSPTWAGSATFIACAGFPWAVTQWIPFVMIGEVLGRNYTAEERLTRTGTIMGLHNIAISAPQVVAAVLSSFVLFIASYLESTNGIGWVLGAGVLPSLAASVLAAKAALKLTKQCK